MNGKQLFTFITLILLTGCVTAQPYYFKRYEVESGLSTNTVYCSLQDRHGFLWFGTIDGLNRFDGYSFKVFRPDKSRKGSIGNGFVISLCEDKKGIIWAGTENGLYQYDAVTESFLQIKQTKNMTITNLNASSDGNIWFSARSAIYCYFPSTNHLRLYQSKNHPDITTLVVDSCGTVWAGTFSGKLCRLVPGKSKLHISDLYTHSSFTTSRMVTRIFPVNDKFLFAGTSAQGLKLFNRRNNTYEDLPLYNKNKTPVYVRDFIHDKEDRYWIATEVGLFIYDLKTRTFENLVKDHNNPYSLSDNAVYTLCREREGGIWAGTFFGGLNYFPKQYNLFEKYFPDNGATSISGSAVREICSDGKGNIWIGTEDAGLNKFDPANARFKHFLSAGDKTNLSYNNIHGLLVDSQKLYIGTYEHGLDVMDLNTNRIIKHFEAGDTRGSLKSNFITTFGKSRRGVMYVGTSSGLQTFNPQTNQFGQITLGDGFQPFINSITEDSSGNIWLSTLREGVFVIEQKTGKVRLIQHDPKRSNSLSSNRVNCIFEASDKTIWMGTEGEGLCMLNKNGQTFTRYSTKDGFPSDFLFEILEDSRKNLWISTSGGLVCFNPYTKAINVFTKSSGLLNNQFNYSSAFKDTVTGYLYFGSVRGLIRFNPDTFTRNIFIPPVYITGFEVDNKELNIDTKRSLLKKSVLFTDTIILPYNQSTFSIKFAALTYTAPEMTEYAYKLEGLDSKWTHLKTNRQAYFTDLSPGDYLFRVTASNSSGVWNKTDRKLAIIILPPWWDTGIARAGYTVAVLLLTWLTVKQYHNKIRARNKRKLEMLTYQKEKEVYQAKIDFFTNVAHEIRTPLTLIKGPLEKVMKRVEEVPAIERNLRIMERNTARLLELATQLLDFRQVETNSFSLNFQPTDISQLLKELHQVFQPTAEQQNIHFELDLPDPAVILSIDAEALNKILSNLISNAIKYCDQKVMVSFRTQQSPEGIVIKVKSDGTIIPQELKDKVFETFYRIKGNRKQSGTGLGLTLSRSLAELMNGTLILDLPENNMNVFTLYLPVQL